VRFGIDGTYSGRFFFGSDLRDIISVHHTQHFRSDRIHTMSSHAKLAIAAIVVVVVIVIIIVVARGRASKADFNNIAQYDAEIIRENKAKNPYLCTRVRPSPEMQYSHFNYCGPSGSTPPVFGVNLGAIKLGYHDGQTCSGDPEWCQKAPPDVMRKLVHLRECYENCKARGTKSTDSCAVGCSELGY
jgi:hypothetical protein